MRAESGNITLDIITLTFEEKVPTKTAMMKVNGSVQFKFSLRHVTTVVGIDESTIVLGFASMINEWFSDRLANEDGDEVKGKIKKLKEEIETEFETGATASILLDEYGIVVTGIQITGIDFSDKVQVVRDTIEEASRIGDNLWRMLGFGTKEAFNQARASGALSEEVISRARDDFLAASSNIEKKVHRYDISGFNINPESLGVMAKSIGDAAKAVTGNSKNKSSKGGEK